MKADSGIRAFRRGFIGLLLACFCLGAGAMERDSLYEDPLKFDRFFLDALRLKHKGEHKEAFEALQHALEIDSTSAAALYEISHYYLLLEEEDRALHLLQQAVEYSPHNWEYKLALAGLSRELKRDTEAIALYEELIEAQPQNAELYYHLSNLYMQQNETDKAIGALTGLENNMGVNEAVSLQKYRLYLSMGRKAEALRTIEALAAKFPTEGKYRILIGDYYLEEDQPDKALERYKQAAQMDADDPYYFIAMSNYYEATGDGKAAALEIEKALKNPSLDIDTKLGVLGRHIEGMELDSEEIGTANALFETLMGQHPQDTELNRMYGQFLLAQGKTEEAKFQLQVATEAQPEDFSAWLQLLDIVVKEGDPDEIIRVCEGAGVYFPEVPEFYFFKGTSWLLKQDLAKALAAYQGGLDRTPPENTGLLSTFAEHLADIHYQLGHRNDAFDWYDKALAYNDRNIVVLNNYAYFLSLSKKQLDKAERMAAAAVKMEPDNATYLDTYAWVFFQQGNYSLAKFYMESALAKSGRPSGEILEHYGDVLWRTGQQERAVEEWQKALPLKEAEGADVKLLKRKIADRRYYE